MLTNAKNIIKEPAPTPYLPITDFARAKKFYAEALEVDIEHYLIPDAKKLVLKEDVNGEEQKSIAYFTCRDLDQTLHKVVAYGGAVLKKETEVYPQGGQHEKDLGKNYRAYIKDTEGNILGLTFAHQQKKKEGYIDFPIAVSDRVELERIIRKNPNLPVVLDFWGPWCRPCKTILPIINELSEQMAGKALVIKVNARLSRELVTAYAIKSIPTIIFLTKEREVFRFLGTKGLTAALLIEKLSSCQSAMTSL